MAELFELVERLCGLLDESREELYGWLMCLPVSSLLEKSKNINAIYDQWSLPHCSSMYSTM